MVLSKGCTVPLKIPTLIIVIIIAQIDKILNRGGTLRTPRGH
jgi:phage-related holin